MKKFLGKGAGFILGAIAMCGVIGAGPAVAGDKISITGSTTVLPIAQKAAEDYMKKHPDVNISVAGTGSGDGVKAIIDGSVDIGDSSRDMKDKEIQHAKEKGVTPVKHVVAFDCIVPVVNPDNPVSEVTTQQLRDIYNGKIKNWKEVGGHDKPIVAVSRDTSSGTFEVWEEKILQKDKVRPDAQLQASNGAVAQAVAGNKYAIGYVGIGYLNPKLKGLKVNGVVATEEAAKKKTYPVARELFMFTKGEPTGPVKSFLDFVKSAEGQKIVKEEGFCPIN
ncbi:MAG: phosphate ABC transporter substrate-binding protein [Deltaproteobacteria bacterium]|nr:phosphate ABC transporter substrate-binding protein [Deltaproteobacteria bacterium]